MDSLRSPVGPEPAHVYWQRRAVVLGGILLVLLGLVLLWPSGGSPEPTAAPTPAALPSASASPSAAASPSASPADASASPSDSASPSGDASDSACADSDIKVTAVVESATPVVGGQIPLTMTIENIGDAECSRDVGPAVNTFTITSGGYRVWSSDDCSPGGGSQVELIPPGKAFAVQATWPTVVTQPGCPSPQSPAQAGTYAVAATNGLVTSQAVSFALAAS